jgi:hypothetical protein
MTEFPVIEAEITFLSKKNGGRSNALPPGVLRSMQYRPHIVLGDPDQRECKVKIIKGSKRLTERYLGVAFFDGPEEIPLDKPIQVKMVLMHYPAMPYTEVVPGETFTLREGKWIVGFGQVKAKYMHSFFDQGI